MKKKSKKATISAKSERSRIVRSFPSSTFENALFLPLEIFKMLGNSGKVRRLTIFEHLNKSPDSGPSRQLVTNANKYGLIKGSYAAEYLELTVEGHRAIDPDLDHKERARFRFHLAIELIPPFKKLYDAYAGSKIPSHAIMKDFLIEEGLSKEEVTECVDTFISNAQYLGLIKTIGGSERLITIDHAVDEINSPADSGQFKTISKTSKAIDETSSTQSTRDWSATCFYISPIGEDSSEERKHADLILGSFVEPAMEKLGLRVVRADHIGEPGMITSQIIEHIKKSKLTIVDLSYLNANVFYEMALRHSLRLPTVQLIRKKDKIPFDVAQLRTVVIDTTDIFTLVPKIETFITEITIQARAALDNPDTVGNPISIYYPHFYNKE